MPIIVVADDLTGAADSAARCHHAGLPAHIFLQPPAPPLPPGVTALSTDSRFLTPAEAVTNVRTAVAPLHEAQAIWYKKIDSTLRGNIGAEVEAMLESLNAPCAVICPAFPAQGRGLVDGSLVFAQATDRLVDLPTLLAAQTTRPLALISLPVVQAGIAALAEHLHRTQGNGAKLFVVDALTDADLETVLAAQQQALPGALLCGSAGLIEPLARSLAPDHALLSTTPPRLQAPLLIVAGSGSSMAHRQIDALRVLPDIEICEVACTTSFKEEYTQDAIHLRTCVLHQSRPDVGAALEGAQARERSRQFTKTAAALARERAVQTIIVVGGDTTAHLLEHLGIQRLTVLAELMPGIPLLAGIDAKGERRQIITKAGNFGDEKTLVQLISSKAPM
jgi:uncharacterized protein YgbK (DUF1537 family)